MGDLAEGAPAPGGESLDVPEIWTDALTTPTRLVPPADPRLNPPAVDSHRAVRGGVIYLSGSVVNRVLAFGLASVLAHHLSVDDFGTYAFAMAAAGIVTMLADLGLDAVTTRELASNRPADDARIMASALFAKAILVGAALVVGGASTALFNSEVRVVTLVAMVSVVASLPSTVGLVLTARVRMLAPVVVQVVTSLLTLVAIVVALRWEAATLTLVAITVAGTFIAAFALAELGRRRLHGDLIVDRDLTRDLLRHTAPLAAVALGALAYRRIDQLMLGAMAGVSGLAGYSNAVRVVDGLNVLPGAVAVVALPALSSLAVGSDSALRLERAAADGYRLLASTILPLAALGTVIGGSILAAAFGAPYRDAGGMLSVLLWAHFFGFAGVLLQQVLVARHQTVELALLVLFGGVLSVLANLWVIPRYGGIGAAWTSMFGYATPLLGGLLVPTVRDVHVTWAVSSARPVLAAGALTAVLAIGDPNVVTTLALFVVVTPVLLFVTGSVTTADLRRIASSLHARTGAPA